MVVKVGARHYGPTVHLTINGDSREVRDGLCVADLIGELGLQDRRIAVEVNRAVLPREQYAGHRLAAGDQIEIVHFVGGG